MSKFNSDYRKPLIRAQTWDYGSNGMYFITICTKDKKHFFGEITNGKMELSPLGAIADVLWHTIPHHAKFVELGEFVVMPNHIHGIVILNHPDGGSNAATGKHRFQNIGANTISSIIGSYKSAVTKHANRLGLENGWQTRFYDRIIPDADALERVSQYIVNNPKNW